MIESLQEDVILVYRNPGLETFSTSLVFTVANPFPLPLPEIVFKVDELLG